MPNVEAWSPPTRGVDGWDVPLNDKLGEIIAAVNDRIDDADLADLLAAELAPYVTTTALTSTLSAYATISTLDAELTAYVTGSDLSTALAAYDDAATVTADIAAAQSYAIARANHTGVQSSATISDLTESVQDIVAAFLAAGTNVTLSYNDAGNALTVSASGGSSTDPEAVRDLIGIALVGLGAISITVNDAADTITITTTATVNATDAALRDRSTHTGTQSADTIVDGSTNRVLTAAESARISRIAYGPTAPTAPGEFVWVHTDGSGNFIDLETGVNP